MPVYLHTIYGCLCATLAKSCCCIKPEIFTLRAFTETFAITLALVERSKGKSQKTCLKFAICHLLPGWPEKNHLMRPIAFPSLDNEDYKHAECDGPLRQRAL